MFPLEKLGLRLLPREELGHRLLHLSSKMFPREKLGLRLLPREKLGHRLLHLSSKMFPREKLASLLHLSSKTKSIKTGLHLHTIAIKTALTSETFITNHLINLYSKCNHLSSAHKLFDEMSEPNLVSWSALISGYDQSGNPTTALNLFARMKPHPNEYVFATVLRSCASLLALPLAKQVHARLLKTGYFNVSFVANSLLSMYVRCGCLDVALSVFSCLLEPDCISYNAMIAGFVESSRPEVGLELFVLMNRHGLHPDRFSYVAIFGICTRNGKLVMGEALHCQTIKLGLDATAFVGNVILSMYAKCGTIVEVDKVFRSIEEKCVVSCNTYIVACSHCREHGKGLMLYREMEREFGVKPDDFVLTSALAACAEAASIRYGAQIHAHLIRTRMDFDVGVGNAVMNMYAKCGSIGYANCLFRRMHDRNLVSWNTMIVALGSHGFGKMAVKTFEQMKKEGVMPDSVTFIGLLAACSHAGLVGEGLGHYNSMKEMYGIPPKIEHLSCLIDLLGRAGRLEEAEGYIEKSPYGENLVIWGNLLSSCRIRGDVAVGERVAKKIIELQPSSSSPYVLLSNLYASDARWDSVAEARRLLKSSGVKKEPGHSLIAVNGVFEKFTVGDLSHARIKEIIEALDGLNLKTKKPLLQMGQSDNDVLQRTPERQTANITATTNVST